MHQYNDKQKVGIYKRSVSKEEILVIKIVECMKCVLATPRTSIVSIPVYRLQ